MLDIIKKNQTYFLSYFVFFVALFVFILNTDLLDATLYFGTHRSPLGDTFFKWFTLLGEAYPYIALTIFFLWKSDPVAARKIAIAGVVVLIISLIFKSIFAFDRPATYIDQLKSAQDFQYVKDVFILRGATSFPSGHTAGAFAAWTLLAFQLRNKGLKLVCLIIAILVGISRVYLTQHFPQDVLFGSAIGITTALVIENVIESWEFKKLVKKNKYKSEA